MEINPAVDTTALSDAGSERSTLAFIETDANQAFLAIGAVSAPTSCIAMR
jgi:hypothetical protein